MKAMILSAGLGTRLKPITDKIPKALVEIDGIPMLQRVIMSMKKQGFDRIVVNVHHFADQIIEFLASKDFGVTISISDERDELLDTGGGIVNALPLLFKGDDSPVLIHNVDIISNADLRNVVDNIIDNGAALLVSDRNSSRKLIFDTDMNLVGWHDLKNERFRPENFTSVDSPLEWAFSGIYSMSRKSIEEMQKIMESRKFSVMDYFLSPLRKEKIKGVRMDKLEILDIGKPASLMQASQIFKN